MDVNLNKFLDKKKRIIKMVRDKETGPCIPRTKHVKFVMVLSKTKTVQ